MLAQDGYFPKNYEFMVETDRDRSLRRRLQTFNLPFQSMKRRGGLWWNGHGRLS